MNKFNYLYFERERAEYIHKSILRSFSKTTLFQFLFILFFL